MDGSGHPINLTAAHQLKRTGATFGQRRLVWSIANPHLVNDNQVNARLQI